MKPISGISLTDYGFATFFTIGVPYGLFIKNTVPCTHAWKSWQCGAVMAMTIIEEHNPLTFDSALLFSPQEFVQEETGEVVKILEDGAYTVKRLPGAAATVKQFENYGGIFPYDLMHICSHGGETDGRRRIGEPCRQRHPITALSPEPLMTTRYFRPPRGRRRLATASAR